MGGRVTSALWIVWVGVLKLVVAAVAESVDSAEAEGAALAGTRVVGESPSMTVRFRFGRSQLLN